MPSRGGPAHRAAVEDLGDSRSTTWSTWFGGQVGGPDLTLGLGADVPDLPGRSGAPPSSPRPGRSSWRPTPRRPATGACARRVSAPWTICSTRCGAAEDLGGLRARRRAARSGSGVRAWRRGSPGWPAGPAGSPPPRSAGGRGRPGTRRRARRGGPRCWRGAWTTSGGSARGRRRRSRGPAACAASVPGRSAKPDAERRRAGAAPGRCCRSPRRRPSALNRTRPSMASHFPSRVWTLFATATWVCRSGSPARESRWVNAAATSPRDVDLPDPVGAPAGEQGVLLDERQRVGDGRLVGPLDLRGGLRVGDRPQRRDATSPGRRSGRTRPPRWSSGGSASRSRRPARGRRAGRGRARRGRTPRPTSVRIRARSAAGTG